jgi:uncharacterized repeat protein (TIGR01451 family)
MAGTGIRKIFISLLVIVSAISSSARDYFTEMFDGDFDLSYSTFTFKPDRSSNGYAVCRSAATEFPTPPTDGILIELYPWSPPLGPGLPLFGQQYRIVTLNPNGSVTYGEHLSPDPGFDSTISNHFRLPRVSAWLGTLGGSQFDHPVHYRSLSNLIAFTWINQPDWTNGGNNSVQLELFHDGVIRLTFLRMDAAHGVVGLSPGGGIPTDFSEFNLSGIGCAGQALYELVWNGVPSTVTAGQPFGITLSGRDAFNLEFPVNGPARLGAGRPNTVIFQTDFEQGAAGFTFSNAPFIFSNFWHLSTHRGTQVGHSPSHSMYFGIADLPVDPAMGGAGALVSPVIDLQQVYPPITLSFSHFNAAAARRIDVEVEGKTNLQRVAVAYEDMPGDSSNQWVRASFDLSSHAGEQVRLHFGANSGGGEWLIDDVAVTGLTNNVSVTPSLATFTGSSWSGNISIGAPGAGIVLIAAHSNGVYGLSAPLDVGANDDLILAATLKKTNVLVGRTNSIDIVVSNTGPSAASSVILTNQLPSGITLGNVAVSQGSSSVAGKSLLLNFGTIGSGGYALASFEFAANASGTLSFTSTVGRMGSEMFLENNRAVNAVNAGEPLLNISPSNASENATNMIFSLQLDAPSPLPVSVGYTTISGTAMAGEDFVATNGIVTFPPFATNAQVSIRIIDDDVLETRPYDLRVGDIYNDRPEYFNVQLTPSTNASIGTGLAKGVILENEPMPELLVIATNVPEGNAGTNLVPVIFRITGKTAASVDVQYYTETGLGFHIERNGATLYGTASQDTTDLGPLDFVAVPQGTTIYFSPGETQRVVYLSIVGDTTTEPDEYFTLITSSLYLRRPTLGSPHPPRFTFTPITIIDDDPPVLSVDDYRITSEDCGTNNGVLDPGETVTMLLRVRNVGYNACTSSNLSASLLARSGVLNPSGPQNYGAICGTQEVWRPFTFSVGAACGGYITATLEFTDNGTNLGTASIPIFVGQRGRVFSEDFESVTSPALPAGWSNIVLGCCGFQWISTNEPPANTNHILRLNAGGIENGVDLQSPPMAMTSSNAWVKIRHRFETTPHAAGSINFEGDTFLLNGYNVYSFWSGSSRGWMNTLAQLPASWMGTTQSLVFRTYFRAPTTLTWEIDSVEVFDGPANCCDTGAPVLTSVRRANSNIVLQWTSISNHRYQLQFKPSLNATQQWIDSGAAIIASGPLTARTNTAQGGSGFYRVRSDP